jgi:hypothetical protein
MWIYDQIKWCIEQPGMYDHIRNLYDAFSCCESLIGWEIYMMYLATVMPKGVQKYQEAYKSTTYFEALTQLWPPVRPASLRSADMTRTQITVSPRAGELREIRSPSSSSFSSSSLPLLGQRCHLSRHCAELELSSILDAHQVFLHVHPRPSVCPWHRGMIRLQRIYNFWCSMLVFTPFAYCFVTLRGTFMHFPELTY